MRRDTGPNDAPRPLRLRGVGILGAGLGGAIAGVVALPMMYFGWLCYAALIFGSALTGRFAAMRIAADPRRLDAAAGYVRYRIDF